MNVGKISKAIAGAAAAGLAAPGATVIVIPEGVEAPWWGYLLAGAISAAIGFATVYFAPANKPS